MTWVKRRIKATKEVFCHAQNKNEDETRHCNRIDKQIVWGGTPRNAPKESGGEMTY